MQFVKPMLFEEAIEKVGAQTPIGSKLNTEEWRQVPAALRENAFFSATIEDARFVQSAKNLVGDFLSGAKEDLGDGRTALKAGSRAEFVKQMQEFAIARGMGPLDPKDAGGLKDIRSETRLSLIFNTKTTQAKEYGYWLQGQDPDVLDEFPAQRFIREADVTTPRAIHQQNEGVVRLKSDLDFWLAMNSPSIGGFGVPWGPWGFNSGMGVEDVDRDEAEKLGLLPQGAPVRPVEKDFNERLQASAMGLDDDVREKLKEIFGEQIDIEGDAVKWKSNVEVPRVTTPAPAEHQLIEGHTVAKETEKALLVNYKGAEAWLPKSQIKIRPDGSMETPDWLMKKFMPTHSTVDVHVAGETEKAYKLRVDVSRPDGEMEDAIIFIPKSQVAAIDREAGTITIPNWLKAAKEAEYESTHGAANFTFRLLW